MRRFVFFEELKKGYIIPIFLYSILGYRVLYKSLHKSCDDKWVARLEGQGKIQRIVFSTPLYYGQDPSTDEAIKYIKDRDGQCINKHVAEYMARFYQSDDIKLAYEKVLVEILSHYFYRLSMVNRLAVEGVKFPIFIPKDNDEANADWNAAWCCFFAEKLIKRGGEEGSHGNRLLIPLWLRARLLMFGVKRYLGVCVRIVYDLLRAFKNSQLSSNHLHTKDECKEEFDLGVFIISPERELLDGVRSIGFITRHPDLDGVRSLYIPRGEVDGAVINKIEKRGLEVARWSSTLGLGDFRRLFISTDFVSVLLSSHWEILVTRRLVYSYIRWSSFNRHYNIPAIVTYADFAFEHIPRNIMFERSGVKTWYYNDSINMGKWVGDPKYQTSLCHPFWCNLYYDHLVTSNDRIANYFKAHPNRIKNFNVVGSLWAHDLVKLKDNAANSRYWDILTAEGYTHGMKLIVLFDSWFHPDGMNTLDDMLKFTNDCTRLLDDGFSDVFVVLKEKKSVDKAYRFSRVSDCDRVFESRDKLAVHERGCVLDDSHDVSGIAALADLVISFPFTSATYECLCAGIKAAYYDPSEKLRNSYYDFYPDMLMHGYDELKNVVQKILDCPPITYFEDLDGAISKESELNRRADGLDRFCQMLSQNLSRLNR